MEGKSILSEHCTDPTSIHEGDLMVYVDGTAGAAVIEHVHQCADCASEAKALAELQAVLSASLYRHSCPSAAQLVAYRCGELEGDQDLAEHLLQCPHCARELADLH